MAVDVVGIQKLKIIWGIQLLPCVSIRLRANGFSIYVTSFNVESNMLRLLNRVDLSFLLFSGVNNIAEFVWSSRLKLYNIVEVNDVRFKLKTSLCLFSKSFLIRLSHFSVSN